MRSRIDISNLRKTILNVLNPNKEEVCEDGEHCAKVGGLEDLNRTIMGHEHPPGLGFDLHHSHYALYVGSPFGGGGTFILPANQLRLWILQVEFTVTVNRLVCMIGDVGAGGNIRLGIYQGSGSLTPYNQPLLAETAAIAAIAFNRNELAIANLQLTPGLYWTAIIASTGNLEIYRPNPMDVFSSASDPISHRLDMAFGALPNPYPGVSTNVMESPGWMAVKVISVP